MEILVFYLMILLLFIGIWETLEKLFGAVKKLLERTYFAKRIKCRTEKIKIRNILENCKIWKKEIDEIYENKKKKTNGS